MSEILSNNLEKDTTSRLSSDWVRMVSLSDNASVKESEDTLLSS